MIYDELKNIKTYKGINKNLDKAIDFIVEKKYLNADFGKNIVDDDKIYFDYPETVSTRENIDLELEYHKKYIDIHIVLEEEEIIGYAPFEDCIETQKYNIEKDIAFMKGKNQVEFMLNGTNFLIVFPNEPHLPLLSVGKVKEIKNVYLDVAHNEDSVEAFVNYVGGNFQDRKKIFVVGFLKDKEVEKCTRLLKKAGDNFILTEPKNEERKLDSQILKKYFEDKKIENPENIIISEKNIKKAFLKALELRKNEDECIFVVGSFYLMGEVKRVIKSYF